MLKAGGKQAPWMTGGLLFIFRTFCWQKMLVGVDKLTPAYYRLGPLTFSGVMYVALAVPLA